MPIVSPRAERPLMAAVGLLAVGVPAIAAGDVDVPGRLMLSLAFTLLVPGVPVVVLLGIPSRMLALSLMLAVSIATLLGVSTTLLVVDAWTPQRVAWIVGAAGVLTAFICVRRRRVLPAVLPRPATSLTVRAAALAPRVIRLSVLGLAIELWYYAVRTLDLDAVGAAGLIGAVGIAYWTALVVVACVIADQLRAVRSDKIVLAAAYVAVVVILFGSANLADSAPGFPTAWVHVGFVDYISRNRAPALGFDARFSWPGFFGAGAVLVDLAGLPDAVRLIRWAPVWYDVLALPALLVIGRAITGTHRAAWLGVFLYSGFNWFSQDYFSPQATVLLLYLATVSALLLSARVVPVSDGPLPLRLVRQARRLPLRPAWMTAGRAIGLEAVLLLLAGAAIVSHQLTPVTLIGTLLAFRLTGATRYQRLWLLVALGFLGWFSFGAEDFWRGHLGAVFGDFGQLGSTLGASVGERLRGNPVHGRMQQLRLLWSASSLVLAMIGLWLRRHDPRWALFLMLLLGPFGLLALQSYGGEVALRAFVYALPAAAPLAAVSLLAGIEQVGRRWSRRGEVVILAAGLLAAFAVLTATRGVNVGFERVTASQVRIARVLERAMPAGSRIALLADTGPLGLTRLTDFERISVSPAVCGTDLVACVRRARPDYLYVTSTMDVLGQLQFSEPPGWTRRVVDELVALRLYRRLASADDALVLGRVEPTP